MIYMILLCSFLWAAEPLAEAPLGNKPTAQQVPERVMRVTRILRCPTCQGVSIADSSADSAKAMKSRVEDLVQQGYSDDQIIDYFVEKYGEWILLDPKKSHLTLWMSPIIFLIIGSGYIVLRKDLAKEEAVPLAQDESSASVYREAILKELEED